MALPGLLPANYTAGCIHGKQWQKGPLPLHPAGVEHMSKPRSLLSITFYTLPWNTTVRRAVANNLLAFRGRFPASHRYSPTTARVGMSGKENLKNRSIIEEKMPVSMRNLARNRREEKGRNRREREIGYLCFSLSS